MSGTIITVGNRASDNKTTRAYNDDNGSLLWSVDHGDKVNCVCVDNNGNVYTGGIASGGYTTRKYNIFGALQWSVDHGSTVYCIAVDSDGYVYVGGTNYLRKYSSSGTEITTAWPVYSYAQINGVCIDSSNNIYFTGNLAYDGIRYYTTKKYNSSGTQQWYYNHTQNTYGINITGSYVTIGGVQNVYSQTTESLSTSTGSSVSSSNENATIYAIANNGNNDRAGARNSSNKTTYISSATLDHGGTVYCIAINSSSGNVYTGGVVSSSITTRKYSSSGTEVTDDDWPLNHTDTVFGIAWTSKLPEFPGLQINVSLANPTVSFSVAIPGLPLDIYLGIPTFSGISQPPDIYAIEYPQQIIYRLYVSGTTLVELPFSSFQCRRSLGQSTFLTIVIPAYSTALIDLLEARKTANSFLIIYSGYIDSSGHEILGEFIKSTIIDIRVERNSSSGTITVYGRVIPVSFITQSRTLHQISKRGKTEAGKKTATCAVDFNLRPNDTAVDGLSSWTVGDITLFVGNGTSYMIVTEN